MRNDVHVTENAKFDYLGCQYPGRFSKNEPDMQNSCIKTNNDRDRHIKIKNTTKKRNSCEKLDTLKQWIVGRKNALDLYAGQC